jgi:hypothetical protein
MMCQVPTFDEVVLILQPHNPRRRCLLVLRRRRPIPEGEPNANGQPFRGVH